LYASDKIWIETSEAKAEGIVPAIEFNSIENVCKLLKRPISSGIVEKELAYSNRFCKFESIPSEEGKGPVNSF